MCFWSTFPFPGVVSEQTREMATTREDGGGEIGSQWVPRSLLTFSSGGLESGLADGPLAISTFAVGATRVPQPSPDGLPQLPDPSGGGWPQQTAASRPFAQPERVIRFADHLHSRVEAEGQRTRRKHYEGTSDGVKRARAVLRDNQVYIYFVCIACTADICMWVFRTTAFAVCTTTKAANLIHHHDIFIFSYK